MTVERKLVTADELWQMPDSRNLELLKGQVVEMAPPGYTHGSYASRLARWIGTFAEKNQLGETVVESGFLIERNPDTVRSADVAFITRERNDAGWTEKFFKGAPDLAIEVVSPDDRFSEVLEKAAQWQRAGSRSVWVVDPKEQAVYRFQDGGLIAFGDRVTDEVLPGFSFEVASLFKR